MYSITMSDFLKISNQEKMEKSPLSIIMNGQEVAIFCKKEDAILIGDLHPRVRNFLKAREALARVNNPSKANEQIFYEPIEKPKKKKRKAKVRG